MISGFQSLNTINSGLILQQLEQDINASNLAQPSLDSQGYLMNSLETINMGTSPSISFMGANGLMAVGTGVTADSITRLRDSFLDSQIRQASSTVGYNEILANAAGNGVLNQINSIINSSATNNLNYTLTQFQSAWNALGTNAIPANDAADRAAVVSSGNAFAQMANGQFNQLQGLQTTYNDNIQKTVSQINLLLQQLNSINTQLNTTQGSNQNGLLDARDYALDKLSRLMNFQVTFGNNGTSNLFLNGISLVSSGGAAQLQADLPDPNNPELADISLVPPASPNSMQEGGNPKALPPSPSSTVDLTSLITGGNLGGELQARNVILQSYKQQVNQIATAVMNVTNTINSAGFASDGVTTGTIFFMGTGASNITVNGGLSADNGLVAESSVAFGAAGAAAYPGAPLVGNQQIALMLGGGPIGGAGAVNYPGLMNLLAQNFAATDLPNSIGITNPYAALGYTGSASIDSVGIAYVPTDTVTSILQQINNISGVTAVYNSTSQQFFIFSSNPVNVVAGAGNPPFIGAGSWTALLNFMVGTSSLNNSFAPNQAKVASTAAMNSIVLTAPGFGPNDSAFAMTPSASGSFSLNGIIFPWTINQPLVNIVLNIDGSAAGVTAQARTDINGLFPTFFGGSLNQTQAFLMHSFQAMQINDISGNFTSVMGLNNDNETLGDLSNSILGQINTDLSSQQLMTSQGQDALNQLNTAQANLAGINTGGASSSSSATGIPNSSNSGVPIASIQQQATQAALTYNALVEVMQVIDNMYQDLINVVGGTNTSSSSSTFVG